MGCMYGVFGSWFGFEWEAYGLGEMFMAFMNGLDGGGGEYIISCLDFVLEYPLEARYDLLWRLKAWQQSHHRHTEAFRLQHN